jgi:hypothetical protein
VKRQRASVILQASVLAALLVGCGHAPQITTVSELSDAETSTAHIPCERMAMHRLHFGLDSGGRELSDAEWQDFVRDVVLPRFPDGFTVLPAQGHWRGTAGASLRETSRVIEIVHSNHGAGNVRVAEIAAHYKSRYRQESVLVVAFPVRACF